MINLAIVEDRKDEIEDYKKYLDKFTAETGEHFIVSEFTDPLDFLANYTAKYDIILLDIEMPYINGIEAAKRIRKLDSAVVIVFITNMPQYALKGYSVQALDYILKPVNYYTVSSVIKKAIRNINRNADKDKVIAIRNSAGTYKLYQSQIIYVEVLGHKCTYHTLEGDIEVWSAMKEVEEKLDGNLFARCNNSFLVNLMHVDCVEKNDVRLTGGYVLALSRNKKKDFLQKLSDFLGGV